MVTLKLSRGDGFSVVSLTINSKHYGNIVFARKIHKYESDSAYKSLSTEANTYGEKAATELFDYLKSHQKQIQTA